MRKIALIAILSSSLVSFAAMAGDSGLKVVEHIKVGGDGGWDLVSFDDVHRKLYVAHGSAISVIDVDTGASKAHFADAEGAHIALPVNGGNDVLITHGKTNLVTLNDPETGAVKSSFPVGSKPDAAIVEPGTGLAFILDNGGTTVDVLDLNSRSLKSRIDVGGAPELAATDGQGLVYSHLEDKDSFVVIDARTLSLKATFAIKDCHEPSGIAFIPKGRFILSACHNGIARLSSADTGAEIATFPIGDRPDGALYDSKAQLAYIPSGDGKLSVITFVEDKPSVIDTVSTQPGARTVALDAKTGHLYLPTAAFGPPEKPGARPSIVPGTFEILVVGK